MPEAIEDRLASLQSAFESFQKDLDRRDDLHAREQGQLMGQLDDDSQRIKRLREEMVSVFGHGATYDPRKPALVDRIDALDSAVWWFRRTWQRVALGLGLLLAVAGVSGATAWQAALGAAAEKVKDIAKEGAKERIDQALAQAEKLLTERDQLIAELSQALAERPGGISVAELTVASSNGSTTIGPKGLLVKSPSGQLRAAVIVDDRNNAIVRIYRGSEIEGVELKAPEAVGSPVQLYLCGDKPNRRQVFTVLANGSVEQTIPPRK